MDKLLYFVEEKLSPPLTRLASQHHLSATKDGMMVTLPLTILGSIFVLIANFPIDAWKSFIEPYNAMLGAMSTITMGVVAIVAAGSVAYYFALGYNNNKLNPIVAGFISIAGFILATMNDEYMMDTSLFGTKGLFTALVIAFLTGTIYHFFVKHELVIKFPDSVPPLVSSSFSSLIPTTISLVLIWIIRIVLGFDINSALMSLFSPFVFALNTLPGFLVFMFIRSLLWSVGIHGGLVLAVADPIFLTMFGENLAAFEAGQLAPYITASGFTMFVFIGGGGATLALVCMMCFSKEPGFKALGRLSLPASIFEINEPVVFGVPLVMNPLMIIPYTATTVLLSTGTYILMNFNIIGRPVAQIPWTMPPLLSHYLVTGGDWRAIVWGIISIALSAAIYYPFFKAMESNRLKGEVM